MAMADSDRSPLRQVRSPCIRRLVGDTTAQPGKSCRICAAFGQTRRLQHEGEHEDEDENEGKSEVEGMTKGGMYVRL